MHRLILNLANNDNIDNNGEREREREGEERNDSEGVNTRRSRGNSAIESKSNELEVECGIDTQKGNRGEVEMIERGRGHVRRFLDHLARTDGNGSADESEPSRDYWQDNGRAKVVEVADQSQSQSHSQSLPSSDSLHGQVHACHRSDQHFVSSHSDNGPQHPFIGLQRSQTAPLSSAQQEGVMHQKLEAAAFHYNQCLVWLLKHTY